MNRMLLAASLTVCNTCAAPCAQSVSTLPLQVHSRLIPIEHVRDGNPMAEILRTQRLSETVAPDVVPFLHKSGVRNIETRLTWYELEPQPGVIDWARFDRYAEVIEDAGFGLAVFPWFQHTPAWTDFVRLQRLDGDRPSSLPSLWDGRLIKAYERLYGMLAEHCGGRLKFLYCGIYSAYGEWMYNLHVRQYKSFEPGNGNYLCSADPLARASFAKFLQAKYGAVEALNRAWKTDFRSFGDDLMPKQPFAGNSLTRRMDFVRWYGDSLHDFCDRVLDIIHDRFPNTQTGVPISPYTCTAVGQVLSRCAKSGARHGFISRLTTCAPQGDRVDLALAYERRFTSAVHFYGGKVALEASHKMPNYMPAVFELEANGASLLHLDPRDFIGGSDVFARELPKVRTGLKIAADTAVFYPVEGEMCACIYAPDCKDRELDAFYRATAEVGAARDYDEVDSWTIADGMLDAYRYLVFPCSMPVPLETARRIAAWAKAGGTLWMKAGSAVRILENDRPFASFAAESGFAVQTLEAYPVKPEFAAVRRQYGPTSHIVCHNLGATVYLPEEKRVVRIPKEDLK